MIRDIYEVTVEMPNGDWQWTKLFNHDFHDATYQGLEFAKFLGGRLKSIQGFDAPKKMESV